MRTPQIHQADLILERQVARNTVISASYLLSLGRELPNFIDINLDPNSRTDVTYTFASDYYSGAAGPILRTHPHRPRLHRPAQSRTSRPSPRFAPT